MYFEMMCSCSASIHMDVTEDMDNLGLLIMNRFIESHVKCGFMVPEFKDNESIFKIGPEEL